MEPTDFYNKRIQDLEVDLKKLKQRKSSLGWLRFGSIAAIVIAFYILWSLGVLYVLITSILLLIIFVRLLFADLANKEAINHVNHLIIINKDELKFIKGDYYDFPGGNQYAPADHFYSNDLDIFGRASLFQYINRAASEMGSSRLAEYLQHSASQQLILQRQLAIKELSGEAQWRQHLQALGREKQILFSTKYRLENWVKEAPVSMYEEEELTKTLY